MNLQLVCYPSVLGCVQLSMDDAEDVTCVTFVLRGEDHTLGNALRYIIMKKSGPETVLESLSHH